MELFAKHFINAAAFSILGLLLFVGSFAGLNYLSPGKLWQEIIEEHNQALAIMIAGISIGLSIIIAASVHG